MFKDVVGLLCHKIGIAVVSGTDNIIISRFLSLTILGAYSNYVLLSTSISAAMVLVLNGLKASFGNAIATKSKDEVEQLQFKILFMYSWLTVFCATSLLCLLQPFVKLWLPDEYAISTLTVVMIVQIWMSLGSAFLSFIAGLQGVSKKVLWAIGKNGFCMFFVPCL